MATVFAAEGVRDVSTASLPWPNRSYVLAGRDREDGGLHGFIAVAESKRRRPARSPPRMRRLHGFIAVAESKPDIMDSDPARAREVSTASLPWPNRSNLPDVAAGVEVTRLHGFIAVAESKLDRPK